MAEGCWHSHLCFSSTLTPIPTSNMYYQEKKTSSKTCKCFIGQSWLQSAKMTEGKKKTSIVADSMTQASFCPSIKLISENKLKMAT